MAKKKTTPKASADYCPEQAKAHAAIEEEKERSERELDEARMAAVSAAADGKISFNEMQERLAEADKVYNRECPHSLYTPNMAKSAKPERFECFYEFWNRFHMAGAYEFNRQLTAHVGGAIRATIEEGANRAKTEYCPCCKRRVVNKVPEKPRVLPMEALEDSMRECAYFGVQKTAYLYHSKPYEHEADREAAREYLEWYEGECIVRRKRLEGGNRG